MNQAAWARFGGSPPAGRISTPMTAQKSFEIVQAVVTLAPVDGEVAPAEFPAAEEPLRFLIHWLVLGEVAEVTPDPVATNAQISPPEVDPADVAVAVVWLTPPESAEYWAWNPAAPLADIDPPVRSAVPVERVTTTLLAPVAGPRSVNTRR